MEDAGSDRVVLRDRGDELKHPLGRIQAAARTQRIEKAAGLECSNQIEAGRDRHLHLPGELGQ
jgi:hypothetical protein